MRPSVETAAGRVFYGRSAVDLAPNHETFFVAALAKQVDGICEAQLPIGRADVATSTHVFEVESARTWRSGAKQVLGYAAMSGLIPVLALFGSDNYDRYWRLIQDNFLPLELLVWRDGWVPMGDASMQVRPGSLAVSVRRHEVDQEFVDALAFVEALEKRLERKPKNKSEPGTVALLDFAQEWCTSRLAAYARGAEIES